MAENAGMVRKMTGSFRKWRNPQEVAGSRERWMKYERYIIYIGKTMTEREISTEERREIDERNIF